MRFQPVKCNMMQLTNKHLNKIQASYTLAGNKLEGDWGEIVALGAEISP